MAEAFVALGSNMGDRAGYLRRGVLALNHVLRVERISSLWSTEPVGMRDQPHFLNAALSGRTEFGPKALLAEMARIEEEMGRRRGTPVTRVWSGPRTLDLDLLLFDGLVVDESALTLPHPRMAERRFVLAPLAEIAPEVRPLPGGPTVAELLAALRPSEAVERFELPEWPPPLL